MRLSFNLKINLYNLFQNVFLKYLFAFSLLLNKKHVVSQPFVQLWMGGALTGSAVKVGGAKVVNGASTTATSGVTAAEATVIVNGVANSGQSKLFVLAGLAARLLLCTVIVAVGYYLAYHWTERYKDAKSWIGSRYRWMRREE